MPTTTWWQAARTPRMLLLLVLLLGAAAVCGRLGAWQLDRAEVRGARAEARHVAEQVAADPVPLADVLPPQTSFHGDMVGQKVAVTGTYDAPGQLVVPGRAHDDVTGWLVLTPLHVPGAADDGGDAVLPVVRGWVASPSDADVPPAGPVDLVGYLQVSESAGSGVRDGETDAISSPELLNVWGGPIWTGYLVVASSDPAQSLSVALLDPPRSPGAGLNIQNLAYAAQWWIFGGFAVALWWRLVRDEAAGYRRPGAESETGAEPEPGAESEPGREPSTGAEPRPDAEPRTVTEVRPEPEPRREPEPRPATGGVPER